MTKYTLHDIHIDPEKTWLMDFDEYYGGKKTYSKYLIEPYGPFQHNEMLDTVTLTRIMKCATMNTPEAWRHFWWTAVPC